MKVEDLVGRIQRKLAGRKFGSNRYAFALVPVPEYEGFVNLVRKGHLLEGGSEKDELREYLELHRDETKREMAVWYNGNAIVDERQMTKEQFSLLIKTEIWKIGEVNGRETFEGAEEKERCEKGRDW